MKTNLSDLNCYLFEELERLNDDEELSSTEAMQKEIARSKAIASIAQQIINNANTVLDAQKFVNENRTANLPKMLMNNEKND